MVKSCEHADADHPRHVGIVDAGADHGAEPRAVEQQPERRGDDHGDDDDRRGDRCGKTSGPARTKPVRLSGDGDRDRVAAPDHQAEIGDDEGNAERDQHLRQRLAGQLAQQQALDHRAEGGDQHGRQKRGDPEIEHGAEQPPTKVAPK